MKKETENDSGYKDEREENEEKRKNEFFERES